MNYDDLLSFMKPTLTFFDKTVSSRENLFKDIYQQAVKQDCVTEDFLENIILREEKFPTGLGLENTGVAIPHTDAEYVKQEFVAVYVLKKPIIFQSMEDNTQEILVDIVFVLGLKEAHSQLSMLQTLIGLMQDEKIINKFKNLKSFNEMKLLLKDEGNDGNEEN